MGGGGERNYYLQGPRQNTNMGMREQDVLAVDNADSESLISMIKPSTNPYKAKMYIFACSLPHPLLLPAVTLLIVLRMLMLLGIFWMMGLLFGDLV